MVHKRIAGIPRFELFISYSRKDLDFVRAISAAMKAKKREIWIDERSIRPTAKWLREIHAGIRTAHTFIFIISPDSTTSRYCIDELQYAVEQGKRLIPIRYREVSTLPAPIADIQWIDATADVSIERVVDILVDAIDTDLEWFREYTRLQNLALEWDRTHEVRLHGAELQAALRWISDLGPRTQLRPTEIQKRFITKNRELEFEETKRLKELYNQALARQLAAQAALAANQRPDLLDRSLLLAIESFRRQPSLEADRLLRNGIALLPQRDFEWRAKGEVTDAALHPRGQLASVSTVIRSGRKSRIHIDLLNLASGKSVWNTSYEGNMSSLIFSPNGRFLAATSRFFEPKVRIFESKTGRCIARYRMTQM